MDTIVLISIVLLSMVGGYLVCLMRTDLKNKPVGVLRVDQSDPDDSPYFFLELTDEGATQIMRSDVVTFEVKREDYIGA